MGKAKFLVAMEVVSRWAKTFASKRGFPSDPAEIGGIKSGYEVRLIEQKN